MAARPAAARGQAARARQAPLRVDGRFHPHAATRAGAQDTQGREALLRYVLRPAIAQERVEQRPDGLVRITLKRAFGDGTIAVDMDPLSLVARLAAAVPPPRFHTVKYAGVLASAHRWRARIAPQKPADQADAAPEQGDDPKRRGARRLWAELLARTFAIDVLACPKCSGRMKLVAMVTDPKSVRAYLRGIGEPCDVPERSPSRGPPYWKSTVLRRKAGDSSGDAWA
ncbi:MAG: transposase [Polyangiaceae bacterium]|nr:transposase [Polyangiaceae bacterium]